MTAADLLTILRLILVPVFLFTFLTGNYLWALWSFALAGLTDLVDGTIARFLKCQTSVGAILDPVADKALTAVTFACLFVKGIVPIWFFLLLVSRDLMILGGILFFGLKKISFQPHPLQTSKWATFFNIATAIFGLLGFLRPTWRLVGASLAFWMWASLYVAATLVVTSWMQYLWLALKILKRSPAPQKQTILPL